MKRYVITDTSGVVDTKLLIPHLECYVEQFGRLYAEQISGYMIDLGRIIAETDSVEDLDYDIYKIKSI